MKNLPRLLRTNNTSGFPNALLSDLQFDKILSSSTIAILQYPCKHSEITYRNEIFVLLDREENLARMQKLLSDLLTVERALNLLKEAKHQLDRFYRQVSVYEAYVMSCESLAFMYDLGELFAEVATCFSSEEIKTRILRMKESIQKIKNTLWKMSVGLLSFADNNWITPDYDAVSELDNIAACAKKLAFSVPTKKKQNVKVNRFLSDVICRLYTKDVDEIESEIAKFSDVDFYESTSYIPEIKFYLEIYALIQKAKNIGVPHTTAKVAKGPIYTAKKLYDVSLLAKDCDSIVPNDATFNEKEPFCFLIGANGGGKTTYLRAVGINLVLFLAGCPVFADEAEIYPFDTVMSHFPRDDRFDGIGRLDEECLRTDKMLELAEGKTAFLLFNETFSGTDDKRGFKLLSELVIRIRAKLYFGLYVTHFHEVMSLDYPVLSAEVDSIDENKRTFRIVRTKGSISSYAADILKKYGLDKDSLEARRNRDGN